MVLIIIFAFGIGDDDKAVWFILEPGEDTGCRIITFLLKLQYRALISEYPLMLRPRV